MDIIRTGVSEITDAETPVISNVYSFSFVSGNPAEASLRVPVSNQNDFDFDSCGDPRGVMPKA